MSFISESSIESVIQPPSLAFPSLQRQQDQSTTNPLLLHEQTRIHFASRLIKLRSELRSPSYATRSSLYYPPAAASSPSSLGRTQSLSIPFSSSTSTSPSLSSSSYHNDDESDILSQPDQGSQLTYLSQLLRATQQHPFHVTSQDQLALPSRISLTSQLNKKAQQQQQQDDHASYLCNSDSDSETEEDSKSVTTIHSFNRRIIQKRQKKPKAFLVKISPSSAAAASVARLRKVNKKRSCSSTP